MSVRPGRSRARVIVLGLAALGYAVDQLTKWLAESRLDPADPFSLLGGLLRLQLTYNSGAAFSLGSNLTVGLSVFAVIAFLASCWFGLFRVHRTAYAVAVGLLIAGIAGNLTDRLFRAPGPLRGHVVDFLQLPYFAIFNVADICITTAAALLIILSFRGEHPASAPDAVPAAPSRDADEVSAPENRA